MAEKVNECRRLCLSCKWLYMGAYERWDENPLSFRCQRDKWHSDDAQTVEDFTRFLEMAGDCEEFEQRQANG